MVYKIKRFFSAFIKFWKDCYNLPFLVKFELVLNALAAVGVLGLLYGLVTSLTQIHETLQIIDDDFVMVRQNLLETDLEIIKVQKQLTQLTDQQDSLLNQQNGVFSWKNALTITGIGIVVGVVVVGVIVVSAYWILKCKNSVKFFWGSIRQS